MSKVKQEQWSVADIAAYLNIQSSTVRSYAARKQMPSPDGKIGHSPWWFASTIRTWRPPPVSARDRALSD